LQIFHVITRHVPFYDKTENRKREREIRDLIVTPLSQGEKKDARTTSTTPSAAYYFWPANGEWQKFTAGVYKSRQNFEENCHNR
jgi:hypothetical protein